MRRAAMIFSDRSEGYGSESRCSFAVQAFTHLLMLRHWWKDKEDIQDVLSELVKIVSFQVIERCEI
ncbi:MAG: hypothetical protein MZU84_05015 [Sphingobacterium sp.]|nr:hypothetical protein [Sphingobacterium sp.]